MALTINQFAQSTVQGQMDLQFQGSVISAQISPNQASALVAGQPVKLENTLSGVPNVLALAAATDDTFGFIVRNLKDNNFPTLYACEVALRESVMYLTAGGAIARGAAIENVLGTPGQVISWAGINPTVGWALDKAVNSGDLIRVYITAPSGIGTGVTNKTISVTATLAQINAGLTLIPGVTGKKILVSNYTARVSGVFATGTSVILESTNGTPVLVTTLAEAGLTNGAVLTPASSNTTIGAGFAAQLGTSDGLQVVNSGSAQTGGTSITFTISYTQG